MKKILLLLSIIAIAACSPVRNYQQQALKWQTDINVFTQKDSAEKYSADALLFAGSSSIRLWKSMEEDMKPYPVINRGYGGSTLSDLAIYVDKIILPHTCKAILIFAANDITGQATDKKPEEMPKIFKYITQKIRNKYPETPIFYIQVTPTSSRWKYWATIEKGNMLVKELCPKLHKVYFIDTEKAYLNEQGTPRDEYFITDKLHQNAEGYKIWADIIKNKLEIVFSKK